MKRILTVYFSYTGNTKKTAEYIHSKVLGDIVCIQPEIPYDKEYHRVLEQAKKELEINFLPKIFLDNKNIMDYDMYFICSPVWWQTIVPPVRSFLNQYDFTGKTVISVITNGGFGTANSEADFRALCRGAMVEKVLEIPYEIDKIQIPQQRIDLFLNRVIHI